MDVEDVLRQQGGVISRRQALDAGLQEHEIRRLLRRNEWARVHAGVYIDHTGPLTWLQRAWAAVLYAAPAALCFESALGGEADPIHVAVAQHRSKLAEPAGVRIHHLAHLQERALWNVGPPRMRYDEAVLDVACRAGSELDAIAVLANACQSRRTTARRLLRALDSRGRLRRRRWLRAVLVDIADGTCSVLEHGYLVRVERPHGLPRATRQKRSASSVGVCYRDAEYSEQLVVELDGRMYHDSATRRDADFDRDLDAAVDGRSTVRLSYGQVFDRPCQTAGKIAQVLQRHGIAALGRPCGPDCGFARLDRAA
ncbi:MULTISPECIES: type IV toxin-antitoxin system AbiEi family antitoxin domain-containing protein [unclassified Mycolicibacterium]|uniref:type IV toxin-antitoxin system AbiEi family antitoxin domain-containing protein n=1 Tax=unclassified Mycolicibacterium TaxID=2636767 RepID=UPI001305DB80|nr:MULTISPECIES: type IV toxin-antitoxin system AbiEi family antitoxin domain-containing protein [unclassified Mycolicibacterium]MUL82043.1 type IV toxin-antitoxin system AbiEi family antitoxin domain-containing protein [Mycolicibacterium sp. CBMA 329]MUL87809.1 type IV toxin-antitoxin system AbiEi family antitoxin domain-containing protein [Mycolicibacterium sp. CBMA 331]MUM01633.1 type IV toxin-antitoxin system AbiEi family antitoxin domain-containing protein [Mycolicibacterium sp. CBMA 334]M